MADRMSDMTPYERHFVIEISKRTGKHLRTCLFCLRYKKGDYLKALELCSDEESIQKTEEVTLISWWKSFWRKKDE